MASKPTPKELGYTMPGEFEKHVGCWMGWPYDGNLWRENAKPAQAQYAAIAKAISQFEPLTMFAHPGEPAEVAREYLKDAPNVTVVELEIEDGWTRDWGPSCVTKDDPATGRRIVAGVHWDYDCYGGNLKKKLGLPTMMPTWEKDYHAGRKLLEMNNLEVFEAPIHLEGGSIHSDGQGFIKTKTGIRGMAKVMHFRGTMVQVQIWDRISAKEIQLLLKKVGSLDVCPHSRLPFLKHPSFRTLMCTEECLLHASRNPHLGREGVEKVLKEYLGLEKIIWFWRGIMGDDGVVNGHVDNFCCFVRPGVVLLAWTEDKDDPQYEVSMDAYERLMKTTDAKGRKLQVYKLPRPPPLFRTFKEANGLAEGYIEKGYVPRIAGERLPSTYINHYCANGGVVVPQFGGIATGTDKRALEIIQEAYGPAYKVVGVSSREVVLNAGNIHCITQQHPAGW